MPEQQYNENPELEIGQNRSKLLKSPESIGKIYWKNISTNFRQSLESLNLHNEATQLPFKKQNYLEAESPLIKNKSFHFEISKKYYSPSNNANFMQINPVTNKTFRISKVFSSDISYKKKTPQLIGKLSISKLNEKSFKQNSKLAKNKSSKNRSPGHFTCRNQFESESKPKINFTTHYSQKQKFKQFTDTNLKISQQFEQREISPQNKILLEQVKQKEEYLKNLIEKHQKIGKNLTSQQPVPRKNIQQFKYNYPVSLNKNKSRINKKFSPYLQKIEQNSNLFQGNLMSPKFLSKIKESTDKYHLKGKRKNQLNDGQQILQKSRALQMRINPEVNISFTIKSPKRIIEPQNKKSQYQREADNDYAEWRQNISRVSLYFPQKNANYNNRKPKKVSLFIDPFPQEIEFINAQQNEKNVYDYSIFAKYFSRSRKNTQPAMKKQIQVITLKTSISTIKQLLIESMEAINIHFILPSAIFDNKNITSNVQIKDLHIFMEKVYHQMKIRPQIVTIKKYKNAIFTGVFQSANKEFNLFNSIIYHFGGNVYIGEWKQKKDTFNFHKDKVQGFKHGKGVEIIYEKINKEDQKQKDVYKIEVYLGQYENNQKQGYGIKLKLKFIHGQVLQQMVEIGCWFNGIRNGWVKTYKNSELIENGQYEKDILMRNRLLRGEIIN